MQQGVRGTGPPAAQTGRNEKNLEPEAVMQKGAELACRACAALYERVCWAEEHESEELWRWTVWDCMRHFYKDHREGLDKAADV